MTSSVAIPLKRRRATATGVLTTLIGLVILQGAPATAQPQTLPH
jgi:hypothetical protein